MLQVESITRSTDGREIKSKQLKGCMIDAQNKNQSVSTYMSQVDKLLNLTFAKVIKTLHR